MDFSKACASTFREVAKSERNGNPTRVVLASRTYPASAHIVWNALTDKNHLKRWFSEVSGDLEPGGKYAIKDNAHGEVIVCEAPDALALTWVFGDNVSWLKVTVEEVKDGALLTLEHEMPTDQESEAHWAKYGPGATGVGWDCAFFGLDVHLCVDDQVTFNIWETWAETEQGKLTLRAWAEAWGETHIRAGADAASAKVAADQTAGFYTGET